MRLVTFKRGDDSRVGIRRKDGLVDLSIADRDMPRDMKGLISAGKGAIRRAGVLARRAPTRALVKGRLSYLPPVPNPDKIICVGLNYSDHAKEAGLKAPDYPILFLRVPGSVVGHRHPIIRPKASSHFDYEAELVVVIGRRGRHIPKSKAMSFVAGYSIANEGSIRDYQMRTSQWTLGKNFDHTGAWGPDIVTPDALPRAGKRLKIETRLNGNVLQSSSTSNMIFDVPTIINVASRTMTLLPGDVILTGTPAGVGFVRKPPVFMKAGDTCEIEIERIGVLSNPVRSEK